MGFRVYILYSSSKFIRTLLFVTFVVSQASALTGLVLITEKEINAYQYVGQGYCTIPDFKTSNNSWEDTLNVTCPIAFEIVICALALYRWSTRFRTSRRRLLQWSVNDVLTTLIRDNIMYFIIAVICLGITSRWALPAADVEGFTSSAAWYINILYASQVYLFSMTGPRMILNIRKHYTNDGEVPRGTPRDTNPYQFTSVLEDASTNPEDSSMTII